MQKNFTFLIQAVTRARNHSAILATLFFMLLLQTSIASAQAINPTPATQSVCVGTSATFTSSYTGASNNTTPQNVIWQFSTDNFATFTTLTPTSFEPTGTFEVTTTITLSGANLKSGQYRVVYRRNGSSSVFPVTTNHATLTVTNKPEATITYNTPLAFCSGGFVDLNANTGTGLSYQWRRVGNSSVLGTESTYRATTSGSYQVTVSNNPSCSTISLPITVRVIQTPTATVTIDNNAPTTFCTGNTVVLRAEAIFTTAPAPGSFRNYTWYDSNRKTPAGTDLAVGNNVTYSATQTGNYYVVITNAEEVTNSDGTTTTVISCPSLPSTSVPVTVNPYPEAAISAPITSTCPGGTVTLDATTPGATYKWYFNGAEITGQTGPILQAGNTGSYGVEVTTNGCSDRTEPSEEIAVTILSPATVIEGISAANPVVYYCAGTPKLLTAVAGANYTYQWYQKATAPNADMPVGNARTLSVGQAGIYYVVIGVPAGSGNCSTTSIEVDVRQATAIANNSITPPAVTILCYNMTPGAITGSTATGGDGTISYTWESRTETGDFTPIPGVSGPNFKDYTPGALLETTYFRRIAASLCTSEPTTDLVKITVYPLITGNAIAASATAICTNTSPGTIGQSSEAVLSGGDGIFTDFQWESSINGSTFIPIAGATADSYTPGNLTQTTHYRRIVRSGNCTSTSGPLTIIVNQLPTAFAGLSEDQILCSTMASLGYTEFTLQGAGDNASFVWEVVPNSGTGNAAVSVIDDPNRLNTAVRVTGTGSVTLQLTATSNTSPACGAPVTSTVVLTVNPAPTASATVASTDLAIKCIVPNTTTTNFQLVGAAENGTSVWNVVPELSTTTATISNPNNLQTGVTVNGTGSVTLRLTTTSNVNPNCTVATADVVLTVNPLPTAIASSPTPTKCVPLGTTSTSFQLNGQSNGSFIWTQVASNGATATFAPGAELTLNPVVTVNGAGTVTLRLTTISETGCGEFFADVTLSQNQIPQVSLADFTDRCTTSPVFELTGGSFTGTTGTATVTYSYTGNPAALYQDNSGKWFFNPALSGAGTFPISYMVMQNGCTSASITKDLTIKVTPPTPTFTLNTGNATINPGTLIFTGEGNKTLSGSLVNASSGTFSGFGVSGNTFNPYAAFIQAIAAAATPNATEVTVAITYSVSNGNQCDNSVTQSYRIKKSVYSVVVKSVPKPFCNGVNVTHTVHVYRDVQSIEYPYLVDANNQPIYQNGNIVPNGENNLPVGNTSFSLIPLNAPQAVRENAYRFFDPIVTMGDYGVEITTGLTYRWTKNHTVFIGNRQQDFSNAGLSSQEYYANDVTVDLTSGEPDFTRTSTRAYTGGLPGYNISLVASPNPICSSTPGTMVSFTTTLDPNFANWKDIGLDLTWVLTRKDGSTAVLKTITDYNGTQNLQFSSAGAGEISHPYFEDGDQVSIVFNSDITNYFDVPGTDVKQKCGGNVSSNVETITVVQPITIIGNGAYCANTNGLTITTNSSQQGIIYQLMSGNQVVTSLPGTGSALSFTNVTAGTYTVRPYIPAKPAVPATPTTPARPATPETFCNSSNPVTIIATPVPTAFNVTVSGDGTYCAGTTGVSILVSGSEPGIRYILLRNGNTIVSTIDRTTGGAFSFNNVTGAGTYTVRATSILNQPTVASCPAMMNGAPVVVENPLPIAYTVSGGSFCAVAEPKTAFITLANSQIGVTYILKDANGNEVDQVQRQQVGSFSFKPLNTAGTYTVDAISAAPASCQVTIGSATITQTPTLVHTVTLDEPEEVQAFGTATYTATSTFAKATYQWYVFDYTVNDFVLISTQNSLTNSNSFEATVPGIGQNLVVQVIVLPPPGECAPQAATLSEPRTPLPVELLYLKATKQDNNVVELEWATAMEQNSEGFEVQVSQDAKNYRTLAFVASKAGGNTNQKQVYTFHDKENGKYGTRYYRLMQRDMNGDSEYFGPKAVQIGEATESLSVYPNPFNSEVNLELNAEEAGTMHVIVTNAIGAKVLERTLNIQKGSNQQSIRFKDGLPQGVYTITTRMSGKVQHFKLLKQQ